MVALFAMTLMIFLSVEISFDTNVEYIMAAQQVNRLKAYHAAKAGVEVSLLRIKLYQTIMSTLGGSLGANKSMIDPVWNLPFSWPPILPDQASSVDVDKVNSVVADSYMEASYVAQITPESGRLNINNLGSSFKELSESTKLQVMRFFESEVESNEAFARLYAGYNFEELVNNIADWIDEDSTSVNGGSESSLYPDLPAEFYPPNTSLKSMEELHMVSGMNDDFFRVLSDRITIYGVEGININYAPPEVLRSLHPSMTDDAIKAVLERRDDPENGGFFSNAQDFFQVLRPYGVDIKAIEDSKVNLLFGIEFNFRIQSTGLFGKTRHTITVVTYDYENISTSVAKLIEKEQSEKADTPPGQPQPPAAPQNPPPADGQEKEGDKKSEEQKIKLTPGRPRIVLWTEG